MDIYLIRHTPPQIAPGTCYGRLDVPLADTQEQDIAAVLDRLSRMPAAAAVWTSPSTRCRQLAGALALAQCVPLTANEDLMEMHFGEWEGKRWDEIDHRDSDAWAADYWNSAPPGGETYRALAERVSGVISLAAGSGLSRLALVTHAGPIRSVLGRCLKLEVSRHAELKIDFGGICLLSGNDDSWHVEAINA